MTDSTVISFRREVKEVVSGPELFRRMFLAFAEDPNREFSGLEVMMAAIAASCYEGAWIKHVASGKHVGVPFSAYWKPTDVTAAPALLIELARHGTHYGHMAYQIQVSLLVAHANFMQRQLLQLVPSLERVVARKGRSDCSDLLDDLSFAVPFASGNKPVDGKSLMQMFSLLQVDYEQSQYREMHASDCLTFGMNACMLAGVARSYVAARHKP